MKDERYLQFRETLEKIATGRMLVSRLTLATDLTFVNGYDKLKSSIEDVADWDDYMDIRAQIHITQWFKEKGLIKEIEPKLPYPYREGYSDILLSFSEQDIYCEVTSPESLQKSMESKKQNEGEKVQKLLIKQPWMSKQEAEHEIQISKITRKLLEKTNKQLPLNYSGILALETGKSMVFSFDVKRIAKKLFPSRPQLMLIMLWSLERGSQIGEAPFWFVNPNTPCQNIGQELLKYLGQDTQVIS